MLGVRSLSSSMVDSGSGEEGFFSPKPSRLLPPTMMRGAEEEEEEGEEGQHAVASHPSTHSYGNSYTCATPPLPWLGGATPASSAKARLSKPILTPSSGSSSSQSPPSSGSIGAEYEVIIRQKQKSEERVSLFSNSPQSANFVLTSNYKPFISLIKLIPPSFMVVVWSLLWYPHSSCVPLCRGKSLMPLAKLHM